MTDDILAALARVLGVNMADLPETSAPIYDGPTPDEYDVQWASDDECDRAADVHYDRAGWSM